MPRRRCDATALDAAGRSLYRALLRRCGGTRGGGGETQRAVAMAARPHTPTRPPRPKIRSAQRIPIRRIPGSPRPAGQPAAGTRPATSGGARAALVAGRRGPLPPRPRGGPQRGRGGAAGVQGQGEMPAFAAVAALRQQAWAASRPPRPLPTLLHPPLPPSSPPPSMPWTPALHLCATWGAFWAWPGATACWLGAVAEWQSAPPLARPPAASCTAPCQAPCCWPTPCWPAPLLAPLCC